MRDIILGLTVALLLSSCYSQKKATEQTSKALDKYPGVVAAIARTAFPCITKAIDSAKYLAAKRTTDSLTNVLVAAGKDRSDQNQRLQAYIVKLKTDSVAAVNCGQLYGDAIQYAEGQQKETD